MIRVRTSEQRGHFDHGWLDTYHTFSFGRYLDKNNMGFRALRVINEDRVAGGTGFGTHGHDNMEIITYVLDGALRHKDSTGNEGVIQPGMVQRMSAGSGITHSEMNASDAAPVHLLQIWLLPAEENIAPGYEERHYDESELRNQLRLVVGPEGGNGALRIHQDARIYAARLDGGVAVEHAFGDGRHGWVQVARGAVSVNGETLQAGDGAAISDEAAVRIVADGASEVLLFDLA